MSPQTIVDRALADFPEDLVSDDVMDAIRYLHERLGITYAPCGIDEKNRLIVAADDGIVTSYDLNSAEVEEPERSTVYRKSKWGRMNAETETINSTLQHPPEFMLNRDTSNWVWVHPQWRYLTKSSETQDSGGAEQ